MLNYTAFRVTDTQDGRYAVEDERGFVMEGLTRSQAKRLKAYLLKMKAQIDQIKREAQGRESDAKVAVATPEEREKIKAGEAGELVGLADKYGLKKQTEPRYAAHKPEN